MRVIRAEAGNAPMCLNFETKLPFTALPPVVDLIDFNSAIITLDCDMLVSRPILRARIVGIGDQNLPGRKIVKIRPHGATYIQSVSPEICEVHVFDEDLWRRAEATATAQCMRLYDDLASFQFGGLHFARYQEYAANYYVSYLKGAG